jgi:16S rRNA (guanine527-N7)-methyltransferase
MQYFHFTGQREVTSPQNPHYRLLKAILESKGICKYGLALISGKKVVEEIARDDPEHIECWVTRRSSTKIPLTGPASNVGYIILDNNLFDNIDIWGTGSPLLVVRVDPFPVWNDSDMGCTLFIPFQDPGNVGSVIRSAAAFGVDQVVLLKEAAHPYHPKSSRASSGALFKIPIYQGPSVQKLRCKSAPLFILSSDGEDIVDFPKNFGILPGQEGPGIPKHLRLLPSIRVPMEPNIESLNAATATAIVLHCWYKKKNES